MAEENTSANTQTKQADEKSSKGINTKTLFTLLLIVTIMLILYFSKNIYTEKTLEYKNNVYSKINQTIIEQYKIMQGEKLNTSTLISASLSKNTTIKKALKLNNSTLLDMDKLLAEMRTTSEYVDIEAEVIDKDGISFKRSWTYLAGDDLIKDDPKLAHLIKYPRVYTAIEATKYGLNMTNKIPVYDNKTFLGLFGVNIHFDALVSMFKKQGFNSVILLNKEQSADIIQDLSFSKQFVDDYYVVNSNANKYLLRIIQQSGVDKFYNPWEREFIIDKQTGYLISKYMIKDSQKKNIAAVIIFKSLDDINFGDLKVMQKAHIFATVLAVILIVFFVYFSYILARIKELQIENEQLVVVNNELEAKTNEMDFNDKKLDNLFNAQPNLMFMHNGKEITKVNKRFMGFFNRFGTFEGFKQKHKCVSELFEKYEAPNYIWEQYIEGYYWIEYILKYPRRLYKVVMSINGDPHHFIIKLNEMDYAKHVDERLIIVALVDMTQDLVNYKTLEESTRDLKDIQNLKDKLEVKEEKANSDVSYELKLSIEDTISVLTKHDVKSVEIDKTDYHSVKNSELIMVDGELNFSNVDNRWVFFTPIKTILILKKIFTEDIKDEDSTNIAQRVIYTLSKYFCDYINEQNLHDLNNGNYGVASVKEIKGSDLASFDNLYQISIKLEKYQFEIFTTISKEMSIFLEQIIKAKPIVNLKENKNIPENKIEKKKKNFKRKETQIKKEEEKEEDKQVKKVAIKRIVKKSRQSKQISTTKKSEPKKLDPYLILQQGFHNYLTNILSSEISVEKLSLVSIEQLIQYNNFIEFNNVFRIIPQNKDLSWILLIPAYSLSLIFNIMIDNKDGEIINTIDDGLKDIAQELINAISSSLKHITKDQVKLIASKGIIIKNLNPYNNLKIYNIGLKVDNTNLPIFVIPKTQGV